MDTLHGKIQNTFGSGLGTPPYGSIGGGAGGEPGATPVFGWDSFVSGVSQLPTAIPINGVDIEAALFYDGTDATASSWAGTGPTLDIASSGTDPTLGNYSPYTDNTTYVKFEAGKVFQGPDGYGIGDIGTDDFVIALCFLHSSDSSNAILAKKADYTTGSPGWALNRTSTGTVELAISDGINQTIRTVTSALNRHNVHIWTCNRSEIGGNGLRTYTNGVNTLTTTPTATGSISSESAFTIGANSNLVLKSLNSVAFLGLWHGPDLFPESGASITAQDAVAKYISGKLHGMLPTYAGGTATMANSPRSDIAQLSRTTPDGNYTSFLVGGNWPRVQNNFGDSMSGYLMEAATTNLLVRSTSLNITWVNENSTEVATQGTSPAGNSTAFYRIDGAGGDAEHGMYQTTANLTAVAHTFSVFVNRGNVSWIRLHNKTIADGYAYFDISGVGEVGQVGAGITSTGIQRWRDNLYRIWMTFTGTVAPHDVGFYGASANNVLNYTGASDDFFVGWAQLERQLTPSSFIISTSAVASRSQDQPYWVASDGNYPRDGYARTVVASFNTPHPYIKSGGEQFLFRVASTGNSSPQEYVSPHYNTVVADGYHRTVGFNSGGGTMWNIEGSPAVSTGELHTMRLCAETNNIKMFVDGVQSGVNDTNAAVAGSDRLNLGWPSSDAAIGGIITKLLVYDEYIEPGSRRTGSDT